MSFANFYPAKFQVVNLPMFTSPKLWSNWFAKVLYDTVHRKILVGEKIGEFGKLWAIIFLANIHRYTENVYGIYIDCCLFAKFFLANSFYLYGSQKFSPVRYMVIIVQWHLDDIQYVTI